MLLISILSIVILYGIIFVCYRLFRSATEPKASEPNVEQASESPATYTDGYCVYTADRQILLSASQELELERYVVLEGVRVIAESAFFKAQVKELILPQSLERIEELAFEVCAVERIVIPPKVQVIPRYAFSESRLKEIILPEGLVRIEEGAFQRTAIEHIQLPQSLRYIGMGAFFESRLVSITIPDGVQRIECGTFAGCCILEEVRFPSTLRSIGLDVFRESFELHHLTLPKDLEHIQVGAFQRTDLKSVESHSPNFVVDGGCIYDSDKTQLIHVYGWDREALELPPTLERIWSGAIRFFPNLKELILPSSLSVMDDDAIKGCKSVTEVWLPEGLVQLGGYNFSGFDALRTLYIPQSVIDNASARKGIYIGWHDKLEHIYVPAGYEEACRSLLNQENLRPLVKPRP